jgi:dephospho-CoA kinase
MLRHLGAPLFDADLRARSLLAKDGEALIPLKERLRADDFAVWSADGSLDRSKLSALAFARRDVRAVLEEIIHPLVAKALNEFLASEREKNSRAAVADIPLLVEAGWYSKVDRVWLVYLPRRLQIKRLRARDGIDEAAARQKIDAQLSMEEKRSYADLVLDNSGSLDNTRRQVKEAWESLVNSFEK